MAARSDHLSLMIHHYSASDYEYIVFRVACFMVDRLQISLHIYNEGILNL